MNRILLVDDDLVIRRVYSGYLARHGYAVDAVQDGVEAIHFLNEVRYAAVVLDLMMPRLTGVEVLKFLRNTAEFKDLPVVVLSNSYMDQLSAEASQLGVTKALLKSRCTPALMAQCLDAVLAGRPVEVEDSMLLAAGPHGAPATAPRQTALEGPDAPSPLPPRLSPLQNSFLSPPEPTPMDVDFNTVARREFLAATRRHRTELRAAFEALRAAASDTDRKRRLESLYRRIHFLTAVSGMADCHGLEHLSSAVEALLFGLMDRPSLLTASVDKTLAQALELFELLLTRLPAEQEEASTPLQVLVVDDDPLTIRMLVSALRLAQCEARAIQTPRQAIQEAAERQYDLLLLDFELPELNGLELLERLRQLPGYDTVPAIFVTAHTEFETRQAVLAQTGHDLIAKPVFPLEVAVKGVIHLIRSQLEP